MVLRPDGTVSPHGTECIMAPVVHEDEINEEGGTRESENIIGRIRLEEFWSPEGPDFSKISKLAKN